MLTSDVQNSEVLCLDRLAWIEDVRAGRSPEQTWQGNCWDAAATPGGLTRYDLYSDDSEGHYSLDEANDIVVRYLDFLAPATAAVPVHDGGDRRDVVHGPQPQLHPAADEGWMSTLTNIAHKVAATAIAVMTAIIGLCAAGLARVMGLRMGAALTGGPTGAEDFEQVQIDYKGAVTVHRPQQAVAHLRT
jgi:hypothetical protein